MREKKQAAFGWRFLLASAVLLFTAGIAAAGGGLNPADPGLPVVDNVYGRNGIANNNVSAMCISCHTAVPSAGRTTHFVSHYSTKDGANRTTTPTGESSKERTAAWTGSGWASRYGNFTTWTSDNTTTGEMICESCHSIVRNVAGGNNLLESSLPADPRPSQPNTLSSTSTTLCEGCHVSGTLPGHYPHPMTGDLTGDGSPLSNADSPFTRAYVNPGTEMGGSGSEVKYPAANALPCLSCHGNGHTGYPGTGARIVRRGYGRDPNALGSGVTGLDNTGIDRQVDKDPVHMISNFTPLCDACHKTND